MRKYYRTTVLSIRADSFVQIPIVEYTIFSTAISVSFRHLGFFCNRSPADRIHRRLSCEVSSNSNSEQSTATVKMEMDLSPSTLSLAASYALAAYLTYNCITLPNSIRNQSSKDRAGSLLANPKIIALLRFMIVVPWAYLILLLLTIPHPPQLLCPNPQNLGSTAFT